VLQRRLHGNRDRWLTQRLCNGSWWQVLLRQLHGNRDRWLKATLSKIAGDVAAVDVGVCCGFRFGGEISGLGLG